MYGFINFSVKIMLKGIERPETLNISLANSINEGEKMEENQEVCFGLFKGMELKGFSCASGVFRKTDPSVADYIQVATGIYRVYFKT